MRVAMSVGGQQTRAGGEGGDGGAVQAQGVVDGLDQAHARGAGRRKQAPASGDEPPRPRLSRQRFLDRASRELADSLDYETTLRVIAWLPVPRLASMCLVQTVDDALRLDGAAVAHVEPACSVELQLALDRVASRQPGRALAPPPMLGTAITSVELQPEAPGQAADAWAVLGLAPGLRQALGALGLRRVLLVPLLRPGRVLGQLLLGTYASAERNPEQLAPPAVPALAEELAQRCALALEHAALYRTAQQAIAARDQFLSIAAHELRAPLTRIKAHAEMLLLAQRHGQLDPERVAWSAERINAAADRLAALTKDVLDDARLRSAQIRFRPSAVDLVELLRDLEPRFAEHLGDGHRLVLDLSQDACPVLVDEDRIEQILDNLLENAAKYSPDGADVEVIARRVDDGVLLQVRDRGVGLPPGSEELIFEPFGRAANAERLNVPGMGLGLHICRIIVERHAGRIWADSAGEQRGTTISVWLPFSADSSMPTSDVMQERLTNQLTLAAGYCELLASSPDLPERLRAQAREAMQGAQGAVATLGNLQQLGR